MFGHQVGPVVVTGQRSGHEIIVAKCFQLRRFHNVFRLRRAAFVIFVNSRQFTEHPCKLEISQAFVAAGIDTEMFKSYSIRAVYTIKTYTEGVAFQRILVCGNEKFEKTFRQLYLKLSTENPKPTDPRLKIKEALCLNLWIITYLLRNLFFCPSVSRAEVTSSLRIVIRLGTQEMHSTETDDYEPSFFCVLVNLWCLRTIEPQNVA